MCGKADSVHSLQGFTIGDTKKFKRLVLNWSQQAEALWAGALYVGASRVMAPQNLAIDFQITSADLEMVGSGRTLRPAALLAALMISGRRWLRFATRLGMPMKRRAGALFSTSE